MDVIKIENKTQGGPRLLHLVLSRGDLYVNLLRYEAGLWALVNGNLTPEHCDVGMFGTYMDLEEALSHGLTVLG